MICCEELAVDGAGDFRDVPMRSAGRRALMLTPGHSNGLTVNLWGDVGVGLRLK